jgi:hypothetical protein
VYVTVEAYGKALRKYHREFGKERRSQEP